ncbi:MAG: hypothetical protein Q9162_001820 [Coniocarpon cinnabarinum]
MGATTQGKQISAHQRKVTLPLLKGNKFTEHSDQWDEFYKKSVIPKFFKGKGWVEEETGDENFTIIWWAIPYSTMLGGPTKHEFESRQMIGNYFPYQNLCNVPYVNLGGKSKDDQDGNPIKPVSRDALPPQGAFSMTAYSERSGDESHE